MRRSAPQLATRLIPVHTLDDLLARDRAEAEKDLRHPWFREELDEDRFDELEGSARLQPLWWLASCVVLVATAGWLML